MMKKVIIIFILLISTLGFSVEIKSRLENADSLLIGTPFNLVIDFFTSAEDSIFIPPIDTLDIFILAKEPTVDEALIEDILQTSVNLIFQPFDVGTYELPEIEFIVKSQSGMVRLHSEKYNLTIHPSVPDSTSAITDIAKPLSVLLGFWDYLLILVLVAIPVMIIYYLVKYLKRSKSEVAEEIICDTRAAYIIALEQVNKLKDKDYLRKGDFLSYYFRLSYILRLFVELEYKIKAVEMTTSEIRANLQITEHKEKSEILKFLTNCDLIKFAKFLPKLDEADNHLIWLEKYLNSFQIKEDTDA